MIFSFLRMIFRMFFFRVFYNKIRRRSMLIYLKVLKAARKSIIALLAIYACLQLMLFGFVGAVASGIYLLPIEDQQIRLWIIFGVSMGFFLIPAIGLMIILSERIWVKASGVEKLLVAGD